MEEESRGIYFAFGFFVLQILVGQERLLLRLGKKRSEHELEIFSKVFVGVGLPVMICSWMQLGKAPASVKVLVISVCQFTTRKV